MEPCTLVEERSPVDIAILEAQNHIAEIRNTKFDSREGQVLTENAKTLTFALTIIAQQLNSQPTHFLLEFIQNADDNSYLADVVPSLSISCRPGYCKIDCNEIGFQPSNVDAICNIGQSTKTNRVSGFIGEKGIGFKSVFKIAKSVWVSSNSYSFKFDRDAQLGMVAPSWAEFPNDVFGTSPNANTGTQFMLQLDHEKQTYAEKSLHRQLFRLHSDSVLLLFLRSLRKIHVSIDDLSGRPQGKFQNIITRQDYHDYGGEMIRIRNTWTTNRTRRAGEEQSDEYFVVRYLSNNMPEEATRNGIRSSEVVLAFPFQRGRPTFHRQKAYAFLPIRESGFRFLLQADFVLIANREDIQAPCGRVDDNHENTEASIGALPEWLIINAWNWRLLEALADCFVEAVYRFNQSDAQALKYTWLGFLHDVPRVGEDNSFSFLTSHIFCRLRNSAVLETQTQGGLLVQPPKAMYVPRFLRNAEGHFVPAHAVDFTDWHYLSSGYDSHDPEQVVLKLLGVQIMEFLQFFTILGEFMLKSMSKFVQQPPDFHSLISQILCDSPSETALDRLALIPLRDGHWIRQIDGQSYFETDDARILQKIPDGVGELRIVDMAASRDPVRRKLFLRLGVKDLTKAEVCGLILSRHEQDSAPSPDIDVLIAHARYLFDTSQASISIKKPQQFWVLDIDSQPRQANTMYLDAVNVPICGILPRPTWNRKLLHPAYALQFSSARHQNKWVKWLEANLDVGLVMRIAQSGNTFTEEFQYAISLPTINLLEIMMASWRKHSSAWSLTIKNMLGAIQVTCEDGQKVRLSRTILPTKSLKSLAVESMPFLSIKDPDGSNWRFLAELGVVVQPHLEFHMKCLELLQEKSTTGKKALTLYDNISGKMVENTKRVTDYFAFPNKAIYIPHAQRWVSKSDCVWGPTAGVSDLYELSAIYPTLQSFFIHHLNISTASIDKVLMELVAMTTSGREDLARRKQLLLATSDFLRKRPQDHIKLLQNLTDKPVMPVMPKFSMKASDVRSLNKATWFFADRHHYFDSFKDSQGVTFADFSVEQYPRLEPLNTAIVKAWGPTAEHCLSSLVAESKEQGGQTVRSFASTEFLRSKVKYLRRITRAAMGNTGSELTRRLEMLHNVNVYSAPHLAISPSLIQGQLGRPIEGRPIPAKVFLKEHLTESKMELQVYIRPHTADKLPLSDLSVQICTFCEIHDLKLQTVVKDVLMEENSRDIDDLLSRAKIDGYDDCDYEAAPVHQTVNIKIIEADTGELEETDKSLNKGFRKSNSADEKSTKASPQALCDVTNQPTTYTAEELINSSCGGLSMPSTKPLSSKPIKQLYQGFSTYSNLPEPCLRFSLPGKEAPGPSAEEHTVNYGTRQSTVGRHKADGRSRYYHVFDQQPITRTGRGPRMTVAPIRDIGLKSADDELREEKIGIQGELKVYRTLQSIFGESLTESCWTSELRELAGVEFSRWAREDLEAVYCDFTVQDVDGRLAAWFVKEGFPVPENGDLKYHIEVKSAAGSCDEPFHMSALQMNRCKELSIDSKDWDGQDIFIIFRLYDLAHGGRLMIYVDPWGKISDGSLEREPDGWLICEGT